MGIEFLMDMAVTADPDRILLGSRRDAITAAELARRSDAAATALRRRGVASIAFVGISSEALPVTLFGAAKAGLRLTPLNYRLAGETLVELIRRLDTPLVVADASYAAALAPACADLGLDLVTTEDWAEEIRATVSAEATWEPAPDDDPVITLFTSGTTSAPKEVVLRHRHLTSYVLQTVEFGSAGKDEATLVSVPPYHIAGIGTILTNLYAGRRLVYLANFTPEDWVSTVEEEGVRSVMVVPTMLARITEHLATAPRTLPSLRAIAYGGAPMPRPTLERALDLFPDVAFTNAYGLTETSSTIAVLTPDDHRLALAEPGRRALLSSAGRLVPGVEGQVRSSDGDVLGVGEVGELWVRGPQVSGEYRGTGSALDADGWFPTRDLAHLDGEGYLYVHGRSDDTIIRGGENIAPSEVEEVLLQHPQVSEVAVVGVADDEWGQRIRAVVVCTEPASPPPAAELRAWMRERVRGSRTPDEVLFTEELPYSATGKLLRRELTAPVLTPHA